MPGRPVPARLSSASAQNPTFTCGNTPGIATIGLTVSDGDPAASCAATLTAQVNCTVHGQDRRHLRGRRLPQPHAPARTARSRCRSWSRNRPTRSRRPGGSTGSCRPATAAAATATARWSKTRRWPRPPTPSSQAGARPPPGRPPASCPRAIVSGTSPNRNMWRWQSVQEFQYPLLEYLAALQEPAAVHGRRDRRSWPRAHLDGGHHGPDAGGARHGHAADSRPRYTALGNARRAGAVGVLLRPQRHGQQPRRQPTPGTARFPAA